VRLLILFCVYLGTLSLSIAFEFGKIFRSTPPKQKFTVGNVEKPGVAPLLKVTDPYTQCKVNLVGVSHGSAASAELVKSTISKVKPSAVILELCDERYLSICLETKIAPNGNSTMYNIYKNKAEAYEKKRKEQELKKIPVWSSVAPFFSFLKSQGFLVGSFVGMGMLVSTLQRLVRPGPMSDEFTTAMQIAEQLNVPIRLGDAQQSATLRSVRKIISKDTFDPKMVINGAKSLAFSAFGLQLDSFPMSGVQKQSDRDDILAGLERSKWVNIPAVYVENKSMINSLLPLIIISFITSLLPLAGQASEFIHPFAMNAATEAPATTTTTAAAALTGGLDIFSAATHSAIASGMNTLAGTSTSHLSSGSADSLVLSTLSPVDTVSSTLDSFSQSTPGLTAGAEWFERGSQWIADIGQTVVSKVVDPTLAFLGEEIPPEIERPLNVAVDSISLLFLIRMAKIIGSDRDRIIASKIQDACKEYPGSEVVVVIGMLHCNGVARWLLSGEDPLLEESL